MKSKKALSNIVSTFAILVITIACVLVVGIVIKNTTENILSSPEFTCSNFNIEPPIKTKKACYNPETNELNIEIEKSIQHNIEIQSIEFIINTEYGTENFICDNSCGNCEVLEQGSKTYYFDFQEQPKQITLKVHNCILKTKEIIPC